MPGTPTCYVNASTGVSASKVCSAGCQVFRPLAAEVPIVEATEREKSPAALRVGRPPQPGQAGRQLNRAISS
jgi:hypothetical protein